MSATSPSMTDRTDSEAEEMEETTNVRCAPRLRQRRTSRDTTATSEDGANGESKAQARNRKGAVARMKASFERRRDAAKERMARMRDRFGTMKQKAGAKISQGLKNIRERRASARERKREKQRTKGTEEEEKKLVEFKAMIESKGLDVPPEMCTADDRDATLMRFLRARKLNLEKAYEMLSNTVTWRKEQGVNDILSNPLPVDVVNSIRAHMPAGYCGYSYRSQPIYVQHLGELDTEALERLGVTDEQYLHYHMQEMEYANRCLLAKASEEQGKVVETFLNILDVEGISLSKMTSTFLRIFKAQMKIDQDNYPETNGGVFIVNAGWVMSTVMAAVGPFIDPKTRAKINVITGDGKKCAEKLRAMKLFDNAVIPRLGIMGEPRQIPTPSMIKMDEEIQARALGHKRDEARRLSLDAGTGEEDEEEKAGDVEDVDDIDEEDEDEEVDLSELSPEVSVALADTDAILEDLKGVEKSPSRGGPAETQGCACAIM